MVILYKQQPVFIKTCYFPASCCLLLIPLTLIMTEFIYTRTCMMIHITEHFEKSIIDSKT